MELLVVLAVVAIMAAFIMPKFDNAIENRYQKTIQNYNSNTTKVE